MSHWLSKWNDILVMQSFSEEGVMNERVPYFITCFAKCWYIKWRTWVKKGYQSDNKHTQRNLSIISAVIFCIFWSTFKLKYTYSNWNVLFYYITHSISFYYKLQKLTWNAKSHCRIISMNIQNNTNKNLMNCLVYIHLI